MKLPDRIFIIGWFWSWKSSLAQHISKIKKIPCFDLDDIRWVKKYSHKLSDSQRKQKLDEILYHQSQRIIEGCVIDWADECYTSADLVVLLKVPGCVVAWRVFIRYIYRLFHWMYAGSLWWVIYLMYWAFMYYQKPKGKYSFSRHLEDCKKYGCKYIIIGDAKEILK